MIFFIKSFFKIYIYIYIYIYYLYFFIFMNYVSDYKLIYMLEVLIIKKLNYLKKY
jgi:hypothetical protein